MPESATIHLVETSRAARAEELASAARRAFRAAGLAPRIRGLTAIKSHFGEEGGRGFLPRPSSAPSLPK